MTRAIGERMGERRNAAAVAMILGSGVSVSLLTVALASTDSPTLFIGVMRDLSSLGFWHLWRLGVRRGLASGAFGHRRRGARLAGLIHV